MRYVFSVPAVPPSLNAYLRMHWTKQRREREVFQELVWAKLNEKGNRCPRGLGPVDLRAVLIFAERRNRDSDNYLSVLAKWVQDSLVHNRIIAKDTADWCTFHPPRFLLGSEATTLITIEEKLKAA